MAEIGRRERDLAAAARGAVGADLDLRAFENVLCNERDEPFDYGAWWFCCVPLSVAREMGANRWIVFDYYAHSVPYAAGLKQRVLGLGEFSGERWPEVAEWIAAR